MESVFLYFSTEKTPYRKRCFLSVDYVKIIELDDVHT